MRYRLLGTALVLLMLLAGCAASQPATSSPPSPPAASSTAEQASATAQPTTPVATMSATSTPKTPTEQPTVGDAAAQETPPPAQRTADVLSVETSGTTGGYQFSVEVASPDEGCHQYADWWEVVDEEGNLIYRRILAHSHTSEQPFVRSGGPVELTPERTVWVRAHMNPGGYGGQAMRGSVQAGFEPADLSADFAAELETTEPLPEGCAF